MKHKLLKIVMAKYAPLKIIQILLEMLQFVVLHKTKGCCSPLKSLFVITLLNGKTTTVLFLPKVR